MKITRIFSCAILTVLLAAGATYAAYNGAAYGGHGLLKTPLIAGQNIDAGTVSVWNSREKLHIQVELKPPQDATSGECEWRINTIQIYVGNEPVPTTKSGNPKQGAFQYKKEYPAPACKHTLVLDLVDDLNFSWGQPYEHLRIPNIAVHAHLVQLAESTSQRRTDAKQPRVVASKGAWASGYEFEGARWGWWFDYEMAHPRRGHFIDSPVGGLGFETPTHAGKTDESGGFDYFPGERVDLAIGSVFLGSPLAGHKTTPLDIFENADTDDPKVINMARLLQSLDVDASPKDGINITEEVTGAFEQAMGSYGLTSIDFSSEEQIEGIIDQTIAYADQMVPPISLVSVSAEDAKAHLDKSLDTNMFRKNVSKTPDLGSTKAKLAVSTTWFPAMRANDELTEVEYHDEDGALLRTETEAKPIIVTYTDDDPVTGAAETWAAVSRDDGNTWKRKNISRSAYRSSFTLANGEVFYGAVKKPVVQFRGNRIMVAWSSKFCRGGKPRYAIKVDDIATPEVDEGDGYEFDDEYYVEDIWGVAGPQRSTDYTELGHPEVGELGYSSVWICRGVIATSADVTAGLGDFVGDIVWFKPERLTSGRRDALQIFQGASTGAGFALCWQEDPEGVRPGKFAGPGHGWSGATTNHKTDIWYSYITWSDFAKIDENFEVNGTPEHDDPNDEEAWIGRPKALVPMALPVRLSDNEVVNEKNLGEDLSTVAGNVDFTDENLTRCVKFEGGKSIVEWDSIEAADYKVLNAMPEDHLASMNCTNCHVPYGTDPHGEYLTQGAPVPLVVIDAETDDFLGGFTNGDCVSCHFSHVVPRDRVIAMDPLLTEAEKCAECEDAGYVWKSELEAYYPYTGYPYIFNEDDVYDGSRQYALDTEGLLSGEYHTFISFGGNETSVAITTDGRLLDGDTGASRANLFLQPKFDDSVPPKVVGAWAIINYEETKGAGNGPPVDGGDSDAYLPEQGKNIIYHSFEFTNPDLVSGGTIVNLPERELDGTVMYITESEGGTRILDYEGLPQLAYENARRARFILQGDGAIGDSRTVMLMVYKEGKEGAGRPSDIMLRRFVVPDTDDRTVDNPYRVENLLGTIATSEGDKEYYADGAINFSTVTPDVTTPSVGDPEQEDPYGAVKVVSWFQTLENFEDLSEVNPFEDARSHRGQIRGDFAVVGYAYTPNWAAARNGNDKYDFFIRRTFDGGVTWTTDPDGSGVEHCKTWTTPSGVEQAAGTKEEVCTFYAASVFEEAWNVSQLPNAKSSVIEPRIVACPGTIKVAGVWTGIAEDKQDKNTYYVAYGTASNPKKMWDPITGEMFQEDGAPEDLFLSFSMDKGESYWLDEWVVNPDSDGTLPGETVYGWLRLAKGAQEQGEVQIRMTPDGSRFYGSWLDEGDEGSDIVFRRVMSSSFPANVLTTE